MQDYDLVILSAVQSLQTGLGSQRLNNLYIRPAANPVVSVEDGLSPAFVGRERPQTVDNGGGERSRFHAQVQQLQTTTV